MEPSHRITCIEALERLSDYVDRELPARDLAGIEAHLARCAACAGEFAFEARVLFGIRARLGHASLPGGLRRRIAAVLSRAGEPPAPPEHGG